MGVKYLHGSGGSIFGGDVPLRILRFGPFTLTSPNATPSCWAIYFPIGSSAPFAVLGSFERSSDIHTHPPHPGGFFIKRGDAWAIGRTSATCRNIAPWEGCARDWAGPGRLCGFLRRGKGHGVSITFLYMANLLAGLGSQRMGCKASLARTRSIRVWGVCGARRSDGSVVYSVRVGTTYLSKTERHNYLYCWSWPAMKVVALCARSWALTGVFEEGRFLSHENLYLMINSEASSSRLRASSRLGGKPVPPMVSR